MINKSIFEQNTVKSYQKLSEIIRNYQMLSSVVNVVERHNTIILELGKFVLNVKRIEVLFEIEKEGVSVER